MGPKSFIRYYAGEFLTRAKNFIRHPITQIVIGVCIGLSAIAEIVQSIEEGRHSLGGHHGLLIFGLGQIFVALGDLREALQQSAEALEKSHLIEAVVRIEEKVVAEAMQIEQKVVELGQAIFADETAVSGGLPQAGETVVSVAAASLVVAMAPTETAGSTEMPPPLDFVSDEEPVEVQVPIEVAPVAVASPVVAMVSTETTGSTEMPPPLDFVSEEPVEVQVPVEVAPPATASSVLVFESTETAGSAEMPPPLDFMSEEEPVEVQVPVEEAPAAPATFGFASEPVSHPSAAEVLSPAPAGLDPVPGPRSVAIQPGRVVLNLPGLCVEGPNGSEVLVPRLLAVPGVERVEIDGDAVTMFMIGGATPGPGLLKATAVALREARTGAPVLPN